MKDRLLCYTRAVEGEQEYSAKLAYSMHLALSQAGAEFVPLHHDSGILFAKATQDEEGVLCAKGLKKPWMFETSVGTFGVVAIRTEGNGEDDCSSLGSVLVFQTDNFITYREIKLLTLSRDNYITEIRCTYNNEIKGYELCWQDESGDWYQGVVQDIFTDSVAEYSRLEMVVPQENLVDWEGVFPGNTLTIPHSLAQYLYHKLLPPTNVDNVVIDHPNVTTIEDLENVRVKALYSDGTSCIKRVDWDLRSVTIGVDVPQTITGRVHQDHFPFPIAEHRADPCIGRWNGKYYFIATNDFDFNHTIYIREADSIPGLVHAKEVLLLDTKRYEHLGNLLWAPEFHIIGGRLCIMHAGTPEKFEDEQCHIMMLKEGGNPMCADDWSNSVKIQKRDGSDLFDQGITLDMTVFDVHGTSYVIWSQRQFQPKDLGAWLYIARLNQSEPWKLESDPVLICLPEYGWENNQTYVVEGAYALQTDRKVFVAYSGAAVDSTYSVGFLSADLDADLLNPCSWEKGNYPVLTSKSAAGEYGTGHNSFVEDDDGLIWNAYHARAGLGLSYPRSSAIRRVHFDVDGCPRLDLIEALDVNPEKADISFEVTI